MFACAFFVFECDQGRMDEFGGYVFVRKWVDGEKKGEENVCEQAK